ncbi:FAD/NAD(P)-binding domain-containing protein [Macroventuria anomochaeta]|uniref:FAD/NAD(P)-binding domain-containing protein n=1 Tax=Macroventuria anomochaeta TaxID=301207 RepID=A0ACB6S530_9PLEO|nr:FAD/NAD(P)-binding domain-containing protein [Macroventuria anomochaeta]KAF2629261.1 FAD/NAD(P)-binding domain-containing protein [Macroventuria anomochaeta]
MGDFEAPSSEKLSLRARSIAVIGAGPSGLVAAKYLRAEKAFSNIVLFEQRPRDGGIWNYTSEERDEDLFTVPQKNPSGKNQDPIWKQGLANGHTTTGINGANPASKDPTFVSPMYERLETNIPRGLMGFKNLDWPQDSQLFPKHQTVLKYIEDYGRDVQYTVRYTTQVTNVTPTSDDSASSWSVTSRHLQTSTTTTEIYDAVVVANGHFITPYIPDIFNIAEWNKAYPGLISHSKYYRRPEEFIGKKVIVVGNSASGADISNQIAEHCTLPLLWSSKSTNLFVSATPTDPRRRELPPIERFNPEMRGVEFEDGTIENDIDAIVFATGYFYSLPFLEDVRPKLITDGSHVNHTYKHLFYAPKPTLSFLALPQRVIPFPTAEAQAAVLARVYSGRLSLPSLAEMEKWEDEQKAEAGDGRRFHLLPFPKDGQNINELSKWALSAPRKDDLSNEGQGMIPPVWGEWEFWCRENFPAIRQAFGKLGEKRFETRTLEEVGFRYDEYKKKKAKGDEKLV